MVYKYNNNTGEFEKFKNPQIEILTPFRKFKEGDRTPIRINWSVKNANSITLYINGESVNGDFKLDDSYQISIEATSTFTIKALALDEETYFSKSLVVNVYPEATFTFESDKEYVLHNTPFTLTWETKNAKKVELNGLAVSEEGSQTILNSLGKDITYTLSVTDEFETKSKTIRIKTLPIPSIKVSTPCNKFKQKEIIPIRIDWEVQNASNIVLLRNGESVEGEFKLKDSYETDIEVSSTFTIQALALDNETNFSESVFIDVYPEATFKFESDKEYVLHNKPFTLSWETKDAKKVELNGLAVSEEGSQTILNSLGKDITYTLSVTDEFETKSKTIRIKTLPIPSIKVSSPCNKFKQKEIIPIRIDWKVQNASNIVLLRNGESVEGEFKLKDSYETDIEVSSNFTIQALALDNETIFSESVFIDVFPEATFTFETDKKYVFPTIPFTLTWETKNAKKVELNGKQVSETGSETIINGIEKDAKYTLSVTDEFETKTKTILVKQMQIPKIETILVPVPNIINDSNLSVSVNLPFLKFDLKSLSYADNSPVNFNEKKHEQSSERKLTFKNLLNLLIVYIKKFSKNVTK